jgi:hypothetical protein
MAKFKAAGSRRKSEASNLRAVPCMILIIGALLLVSLLFYEILKSGS